MTNPATLPMAGCRPANNAHITPTLQLNLHLRAGITVKPVQRDDVLTACTTCKEECWIGPAKLAMVTAGRAVAVCWPCLWPVLRAGYYNRINVDTNRKRNDA